MDDAKLPVDYEIDYVRVWQRKDLASGVDGFVHGMEGDAVPAQK